MQQDVAGQAQQQFAEQQAMQQQVDMLEQVVKSRMTREAISRYGNVKAAHPEKAIQLLAIVGQLIQSGQIDMIDDEKLKGILQHMTPEKRETKITRK